MIIASCPVRISFASADHEPFSSRFGGNALNFTINKRVYIFIRPRNHLEDTRYRISYAKTELCNDVNDIQLGIVREAMKMLKITDPMEIIYTSDVPSKLGLGTSSAMAAAVLKALMYFKGWGMSTEMLVDYTYKLEREILNEIGGFQDEYAVCFGGINYLEGRPYNVKRTAVALHPAEAQRLMSHMFLVYTGNNGQSSEILKDQLALLKCGETLDETLRIKKMVHEMYAILTEPQFSPTDLAYVMKEAWELKKKLSYSMAGPQVKLIEDTILDVNPKAGLRLVGGGGDRGMVLIMTDPKFKDIMKKKLAPLKTSEVEFEWEGCTVRRMFHGGYNE